MGTSFAFICQRINSKYFLKFFYSYVGNVFFDSCLDFNLQAYANWLCVSNVSFEPEIKPMSGHLSKLKRTPTSFSTSWNKRYFRINAEDKTLEYFNKEPKSSDSTPNDRRVIHLDNVVEVRVMDPWTFQLEVKEIHSHSHDVGNGERERVHSVQLRSGGMNFFCLQAKTPNEQTEWRTNIENYVNELQKYNRIRTLEERALDARRSVTTNAMDMELERVMDGMK